MIRRIQRITMAVTRMEKMVTFYNAVFDARLTPFEPFKDVTFYRGKLVDIDLLLCPNHVAYVQAERNRQQFNFLVDDVVRVMQIALQSGGKQIDSPKLVDGVFSASVFDPDGNSIEFEQADDNSS